MMNAGLNGKPHMGNLLKFGLFGVFSGDSGSRRFARHTKARRLAESLTRLKRRAVSPA